MGSPLDVIEKAIEGEGRDSKLTIAGNCVSFAGSAGNFRARRLSIAVAPTIAPVVGLVERSAVLRRMSVMPSGAGPRFDRTLISMDMCRMIF